MFDTRRTTRSSASPFTAGHLVWLCPLALSVNARTTSARCVREAILVQSEGRGGGGEWRDLEPVNFLFHPHTSKT